MALAILLAASAGRRGVRAVTVWCPSLCPPRRMSLTEVRMSPAVQTQNRDWWEVARDHATLGQMASQRAPLMSSSREGRSVDGTQGLMSTLPKSLVLAKKRLGVAS